MPKPSPGGPLERPILGLTPFERPDAPLCIALCRAGAAGVLDLGRDPAAARAPLAALAAQVPGLFGVRFPEGAAPLALPDAAAFVLFPSPEAMRETGRPALVQVTSAAEARLARARGAAGLVAKGAESGGRVGEETAFILLQRLVQEGLGLPVWLQGAIGLHGAAAARAAGARGVLLDSQLALLPEAGTPPALRAAIAAMDGGETAVIAGQRVLQRPDLPAAKLGAASVEEVLGRLGDDLAGLVPVGQEGAFAASLAARFSSAGALVRGVARAAEEQLREARRLAPFAPGSPLARRHGLRFPIVQGPMTRVSDGAPFARAVADGGGLPFLALALLDGAALRRLLDETRELLGDRPFGVGLLGFAPEALRAEQLAVVEAARPPAALIAGGRPDQARALEERGIPTYLHVPSPAILSLALAAGVRRFVLEGRESGGHVGPRGSLALWEQAMGPLLSHPAPAELSVLFAGGIHDGLSAAMVAALAAPLAARGAALGLLMGTAYLFTEEAVATGAIGAEFQEAAIACDGTALLETAPGHATRCVETEYVRTFRAEREKLAAEGLDPREIWARLEQMNLGRLRIAAKRVRREGGALVPVDALTQRREGLFMIGQAASLRSARTTIERLHREVSEGGTDRLEALAARQEPAAEPRPLDVAIVGMAAIFPGAPDLVTYWGNILAGVDSVREVDRSRWDPAIYFDPGDQDGTKTPCKWGGFLPEVPFDPLSFGLPPRSLPSIDPAQLLALEVARRALDDAGCLARDFPRERTAVIFGAEGGTDLSTAYGFRALYPQLLGPLPGPLAERLPSLSEDSFAGVLGNVIAGRIANRLDLGGPNYTVDAACASSLAALDLAVKELATGGSDLVLCGAADLHNGINDYLMFASVHALSRRGRCAPFDAGADGIVLGEGVACLVVKRAADARRDGDRIYAIVRGVGGASDGRSLGLTAPRKEGQVRAMERAYEKAGLSPAEVGLVEAHGTGTVVGDRTELASLDELFRRAGAGAGSVALGSVKSQIGHTKCAAGMAGIIKAALALYHHALPPTIHVEKPNPGYDVTRSPFTLSGAARPWIAPEAGPRRAAVSAFGFGGTNFHVVLDEAPRGQEPESGGGRLPAEIFVLRGTVEEARAGAAALAARLAAPPPGTLADLAYTIDAQGTGPARIAIVAESVEKLRASLERAARGERGEGVFLAEEAEGREKVAFLFPGQGSQRPGMLGELFVAFPELSRHLEAGRRWAGLIHPAPGLTEADREAQAAALTDTRVAQPALGVVELAALELLAGLGVLPDLVAGHSFGELTALCAAGALTPADLPALSEARAHCILGAAGAEPGAMAAVSAPLADIREWCAGAGVTLVNENAPGQGVIAGSRTAIEAALVTLREKGIAARRLQVACAFHSPLLAGADAAFARTLSEVTLKRPALPVFSNVTAEPYPDAPEEIRRLLARQLVSPVRFAAELLAMYDAGARIFVEVGPGQVLTRLAGQILAGRPHLALAVDHGGGLHPLLTTLAALLVRGVPVRLGRLFAGRRLRRLELDRPAARPASLWIVDGHRARPALGEVPPGGLRPAEPPLSGLGPAGDRETTVLAYLKGMERLVETEREVMLKYLGEETSPARAAEAPSVPAPRVALEEKRGDGREQADATVDIARLLLALVSERTGYPQEMLSLDADLEAELSIDSIKRLEILGTLTQRLGLSGSVAGAADLPLEKLAAVKTLRGITSWIETRLAGGAAERQAPVTHPAGAAPAALCWARPVWIEAPARPAENAAGLRVWVAPRTPFAELLAGRLREAAAAVTLRDDRPEGPIDVLLDVSGLDAGAGLWPLFSRSRDALAAGARRLFAATGLAGEALAGAGVAGLLKSLAREVPAPDVRAIDLDPAQPPVALAASLVAETLTAGGAQEVAWRRGARWAFVMREGPRPRAGVILDRDSVVLLTGGARGITAGLAVSLARRFQCALVLAGTRPPPGAEPPDLAAASDLPALRRALLARAAAPVAAVEAAARGAWADREIRRTMAAIAEAGGRASYHAVDVRDETRVAALVAAIYERHGRLDAAIHGAGVTDDRSLADKEREGFERVLATKLGGALALARHLRDDLRLFALFGSVAGVFGNRGQADYAAANAALDRLAASLAGRFRGPAVALDFGPWAGAGMVGPELAAEYARRAIPLVPLDAGIAEVTAALFDGPATDPVPSQALLCAGGLAPFAGVAWQGGADEAAAERPSP